MQDIWVSLHSIRSRSTLFRQCHCWQPLHATRLSRSCWVSSNTGHHQLEAYLRSARLQSLLEVGPARLLAAMLGDLGVSTLCSIKTMTQFSPFFEHQTSHAAYFNARGLLYECVFDALLFSSSYRPVGKSVSHHVATRPVFFSLHFGIIILAILPSTMLGYYSMSASSMPSEFFIVVSIYWKSASYRSSLDIPSFGKTTDRSTAKLTCSFFFWTDVHAIRPVDGFKTSS
jgi:hypothetical protein